MSFTFYNQGNKVKMEVIPYVTTVGHKGRRGSPAIPPGTTVYLVKYANGGYFTYSYLSADDARESIKNAQFHGTDNEYYREWNIVHNPEHTMHVSPRTK